MIREGTAQKYICGFVGEKEYLVSIPWGYHLQMKRKVETALEVRFGKNTLTGAWLRYSEDVPTLFGDASDVKPADNEITALKLRNYGLNTSVDR